MRKEQNKRIFSESNVLLLMCLISSTIFMGLYAMINIFVTEYPDWLGLVIFGINLLFISIVLIFYRRKRICNFQHCDMEHRTSVRVPLRRNLCP